MAATSRRSASSAPCGWSGGSLGTFRQNEGLLELGRLCLLWTAVEGVKLPQRVRMTPEQLGLDQKDPKALRLPAGLEEVGDWWFEDSALERVGYRAFARTLLAPEQLGFFAGLEEREPEEAEEDWEEENWE